MDTSPANVSPEYVAVPETAATTAVPPRVPPEAVAVTVAMDVVVLPPASRMITTGWVLKADPTNCAPVRVGCVWMLSWAGGPARVFAMDDDSWVTAPLVNLSL